MAANKDLCSVCRKPFCGKQKVIRCGSCDIQFHCHHLKISGTEIAIYTASGRLSYKCEDCTKLLKTSSTDETPVKMQWSLSTSNTTKKELSPEWRLMLPLYAVRILLVYRLRQYILMANQLLKVGLTSWYSF
jgi:hypothetical protein